MLGREPVEVDLDGIAGYVSSEVVMVTGAGGSIGSELCRQLARLGPARLVLVDHSEPALFEVDRELVRERGFLAGVPVVADVKDGVKLRQVFDKYRPGVVFHAAAYKHVAMMEANPIEAVRNNTLGTRTLADVAVEFGAKRFVLVSTDKAANPKTIMGQSKALCEWIVETWGHRADVPTRFVAVRFGNVLGSSGSVIPIFRRQIAKGGPVTVTHPEMTRFFMTIPEAVQLVVQAGAIAERGQVYVLDMGEPVRIMDLAENMIRLSGKEPGTEIAIEMIGPAPGEKLHEVLVGDGELVTPSPHPKIERISRPPVEAAWLDEELAILERLVEEGDTLELVGALSRIVSEPRRVAATASPPSLQPGLTAGTRGETASSPSPAQLASADSSRSSISSGSRCTRRSAAVFFSSTSASASVSSASRPSAIRPSSTAPILPANVVQTGVPSATASRFIVPPAETTRSASAIRLCASIACSGTTSDGSAASWSASRCVGVRGRTTACTARPRRAARARRRRAGCRGGGRARPRAGCARRRAPGPGRGRARRSPRDRARSPRGSTPPSGLDSGVPLSAFAPSLSSRSCGIASGTTTRVAAREPSVCWARANS